mmetsp:Transcript_105648/g.297176  ORF Transcript_105648/g.297176 Transcript_105648/m.297176 type:complete len:439 (-) Transcript_105648:131-1447(-)
MMPAAHNTELCIASPWPQQPVIRLQVSQMSRIGVQDLKQAISQMTNTNINALCLRIKDGEELCDETILQVSSAPPLAVQLRTQPTPQYSSHERPAGAKQVDAPRGAAAANHDGRGDEERTPQFGAVRQACPTLAITASGKLVEPLAPPRDQGAVASGNRAARARRECPVADGTATMARCRRPTDCAASVGTCMKRLLDLANASLQTGKIIESVKLPPGISPEPWIAAQTISVFEEVEALANLLYVICTDEDCPEMRAGPEIVYFWSDERNPTPHSVTANEYMTNLLEWGSMILADEDLIPRTVGRPFPKDFRRRIAAVLRRSFRVYAHAYLEHFDSIKEFGAQAHVNCCFKRYLFFVREFDLVDDAEFEPLAPLVNNFLKKDGSRLLFERKAVCSEGKPQDTANARAKATSRAPDGGRRRNSSKRTNVMDTGLEQRIC